MQRLLGLPTTMAFVAINAAFCYCVVFPALDLVALYPVQFAYLSHFGPHGGMNILFLVKPVLQIVDSVLIFLWGHVLGLAALRAVRRRIAPKPARTRRKAWRWIERIGIGLLIVLTVPFVGLYGAYRLHTGMPAGHATFERRCTQCHSTMRILSYMKYPRAWEMTVQRMQAKDPGWISDEEAAAAVSYLKAVRGWSEAEVLEAKCLTRCHDASVLDRPRTRGSWERLVGRMVQFQPFFITPLNQSTILAQIEERGLVLPDAQAPGDETVRAQYETACGQCHTLDVIQVRSYDEAGWETVLARMHEKAPWQFTDDELDDLRRWILEARGDADRFATDVPHHTADLFYSKFDLQREDQP